MNSSSAPLAAQSDSSPQQTLDSALTVHRCVNKEGKIFNYPSMKWLDFTLGDPNRGYTEKRNAQFALKLLRPHHLVADVGAFIGEMAIHWAPHVQRIDLYEASPRMIEIAEQNMLDNGITNVLLHNHAVGANCGFADFYFNPYQPVLSGIDQGGRRHFHKEVVSVVSLDWQDVPYDYVKIDVEGHELSVLHGMTKLLEDVEPVIQIELMEENLKRAGHTVRQVVNYILEHGYTGFDCRGLPLQIETMKGKDGFFIPNSKLAYYGFSS